MLTKGREYTGIEPGVQPGAETQRRPDDGTGEVFTYYRRLGRVQRFIESHLSEDLSLFEVAKVAGLSPKYFSVFFRQHTGVCFRDWVAMIRVERAKSLFEEKNRPIARVAHSVGFNDVRTFQRSFKKVTGMTPRAYKKSVAP